MAQLEQFTNSVDSVDTVVSRMHALDAVLPERDGIAVFNRVYLTVTEAIDRRLDSGHFPDAEAAITLDVLFAERYLRVAEGGCAPACWRPLLQFRHHPGVRPLQLPAGRGHYVTRRNATLLQTAFVPDEPVLDVTP